LRRKIKEKAVQFNAKLILIEEAGSGVQLIQDLKREGKFSIKGIVPKMDKVTRLYSVSHLIEAGQIFLPKDAGWLATFKRELLLFPSGKYDDQVDSLSQFLGWLGQPIVMPRIRFL
jgi:predicted phage terminase large subunit-like protein